MSKKNNIIIYTQSYYSLTNSAGNIVESYDYEVYGERTAFDTTLTEIGYTGQRHDTESTGLMYFKNRYYSPSMGQFTSRDLLGYVDGMSMYQGYFGAQGVDPFGLSQEEGHFYTTFLMAIAAGMGEEEATELAVYSQMPDEVADFDAIEAQRQVVLLNGEIGLLSYSRAPNEEYKKLKREKLKGLSDQLNSAKRWRDLIQKYVHSLTGDSAKFLRDCLIKMYHDNKIADKPWKKGFLIHAYQDTYAHTDESKKYGTAVTHPTGMGHGELKHLFVEDDTDYAEEHIVQQRSAAEGLLTDIFDTGNHNEKKKKNILHQINRILREGKSKGNPWVKDSYRELAIEYGYGAKERREKKLVYDPVLNNDYNFLKGGPDSKDIPKQYPIPTNNEVKDFLEIIEKHCFCDLVAKEQELVNKRAKRNFINGLKTFYLKPFGYRNR